jgi:hypothetical protein
VRKKIDLDRNIAKEGEREKKGASVSHQRPDVFSFIAFSLLSIVFI